MSGVTALPFRRIVKRHGAALVVSEMIASQAAIRETRQSLTMAQSCPEEQPMAVQLAGCEPGVMAEAAKLNADRGARLIDNNFGCPVKKVGGGGRWGGWCFRARVVRGAPRGGRRRHPPLAAQYEIVRGHYDDMLSHYGVAVGLRIARKHLAWYSKGLPGSAEFRAAVNRTDEVPRVSALLRAFSEPLLEAPTPSLHPKPP